MKFYRHLLLVSGIVTALASTTVNANEIKPFPWPNGAKAAVNLAYDDALNSQLDIVVPQLDKAGLKGTFYISLASDTLVDRLNDWRSAAKNGHELGNHSLFHQCSKTGPGRDWVSESRNLDNLSVEQMADQVRLANSFLHAIDGKTERTYTPPCIDKLAGGKPYWPAIIDQFVALKGKGGGVTENMWTLDPYEVGVDFPNGHTGDQLIDMVKEAAAKGTMVNFTFHGVGGDHMAVSAEAHQALVDYLVKNKDIYYVDTFVNIMTHVKKVQAAK
ncbi:MAG: polysaccharide deacetylase family protein [Cellvibrio sp.]